MADKMKSQNIFELNSYIEITKNSNQIDGIVLDLQLCIAMLRKENE